MKSYTVPLDYSSNIKTGQYCMLYFNIFKELMSEIRFIVAYLMKSTYW